MSGGGAYSGGIPNQQGIAAFMKGIWMSPASAVHIAE